MSIEDVKAQVQRMAADRDPELDFSSSDMAGMLMHVLAEHEGDIPEQVERALYLVSSCLMRAHCDAIEVDVLAARRIYKPEG